MFILKYTRSAFERQIDEAVSISKEAERGEILNSKSEYSQSSLPRLVTKISSKNEEYRELEKEIKIEKEKEDIIEMKIRNLRKEKNKARLITEKNHQPRKKQKLDETNYISIRNSWGPPPTSVPRKKEAEEHIERNRNNKRRKVEHLTNIRRIEDKIVEEEEITEFEVEKVDWDKVLKDHKERLSTFSQLCSYISH